MDVNAFLTIGVGIVITVIGFFLKRSYDDVRRAIDELTNRIGAQNGRITKLETQAEERLRVSNEKHDDLEEMIRNNKSEVLTRMIAERHKGNLGL